MPKWLLSLFIGLTLLIATLFTVTGQSPTAFLTPFVVDIHQQIPTTVTLTLDDGLTTTVPLTLTVNLQIAVSGPHSATVTTLANPTPVVAVATVPAATSGKPSTIDPDNPLSAFTVAMWQDEATVDLEGIVVTLHNVQILDWAAMQKSDTAAVQDYIEELTAFNKVYDDANLIGTLDLRIENTTDKTYGLNPFFNGIVKVGDEQVDLSSYLLGSGRTLLGDTLPGVIKDDTITFTLKRTTIADLQTPTPVMLRLMRPTLDNFLQGDEDYLFTIELTHR
ncbi:MAG: hypothetical protein AB7R40_22415 [Nitrospiraceae bacterium]